MLSELTLRRGSNYRSGLTLRFQLVSSCLTTVSQEMIDQLINIAFLSNPNLDERKHEDVIRSLY